MLNARGESLVQISGRTEDGRYVLKGVFQITASLIGLPLEVVLDMLEKQRLIVDWLDYYREAVRSGMRSERVIERVSNAVGDVLGPEVSKEVVKRLKIYIGA